MTENEKLAYREYFKIADNKIDEQQREIEIKDKLIIGLIFIIVILLVV